MGVIKSVNLVVNAGGLSRRMGRVKALLPVPPDDTPLIIYIVRRLMPLVTGQVVIVTNDTQVGAIAREMLGLAVVRDQWVDGGALGGVATGLAQACRWAMVVACDMPMVSPAIFAKLLAIADGSPEAYAVIPRIGGRAQPFHGLWHGNARPVLAAQIGAGQLAVHRALEQLPVRWVDEAELGIATTDPAFMNVNTPADWAELHGLLEDQNRPVTK